LRFDIVLCTEVIENTTEPARAVAKLCRGTAHGGIVVVAISHRVWKPAVWVAKRSAPALQAVLPLEIADSSKLISSARRSRRAVWIRTQR
jgi:2-polyprenyl-3-methyl-5-hydroxy-6-metoxy-1,4-benzoquinol methylase